MYSLKEAGASREIVGRGPAFEEFSVKKCRVFDISVESTFCLSRPDVKDNKESLQYTGGISVIPKNRDTP